MRRGGGHRPLTFGPRRRPPWPCKPAFSRRRRRTRHVDRVAAVRARPGPRFLGHDRVAGRTPADDRRLDREAGPRQRDVGLADRLADDAGDRGRRRRCPSVPPSRSSRSRRERGGQQRPGGPTAHGPARGPATAGRSATSSRGSAAIASSRRSSGQGTISMRSSSSASRLGVRQAGRGVDGDALVGEPGAGVEARELAPVGRGLADLLGQLALRGVAARGSPSTSSLPAGISSSACSPAASRGWRTSHTCSSSWATTPTAPGCATTSRSTSSPSSWRKRSTRTLERCAPSTPSPSRRAGSSCVADHLRPARARRPSAAAKNSASSSSPRPIVPRGQAAGAVAVEVGAPRGASRGARRAAPCVRRALRRGDDHRLEQQREHGRGVMREPAVARAVVARGHAGKDDRRAPSASAACTVSSAVIPPCPSARRRSRGSPAPGPHSAASQPSSARAWWIAPAVRDRLAVAAVRRRPRSGGPASSPRAAQLAHRLRQPAGQGAARRLHVAELGAGARLAERPRDAARAARAGRTRRPAARAGSASASPSTGSTACWRLV